MGLPGLHGGAAICNKKGKKVFNIEEERLENDANPVQKDVPNGEGKAMGWNSTVEFQRLYDSAFQVLLRVAFRITNNWEAAEDLCQESFFRLYERNMVFPNQEEAKYWLIRVVKNAALNYAKRKERERKAYQRAFREDHRQEETGEGLLVKKETSEEVKSALEKLPDNLRMVLILKEYAEMNYKEIGKALGISEGNVKVRVFRARERLAILLAEALQTNNDLQGGKNVS
jgi:RNA polymerase sigma-70 factor (ECF subfamily)